MDRYPPIAEHGLIGDLQTAALVTTDGTVDWWCTPRFDSPSVHDVWRVIPNPFAVLLTLLPCVAREGDLRIDLAQELL
jgi:GH15 family glucan-1,4-alpha-glucosidase